MCILEYMEEELLAYRRRQIHSTSLLLTFPHTQPSELSDV